MSQNPGVLFQALIGLFQVHSAEQHAIAKVTCSRGTCSLADHAASHGPMASLKLARAPSSILDGFALAPCQNSCHGAAVSLTKP